MITITQEEILTFLSIVQNRSIFRASEKLFLSQSTVSNRLQNLENEIGVTLINRKKGIKAIELTPAGEAFISLAERWLSLCQETQQLKMNSTNLHLSIACNDSLSAHLFAPMFKHIYENVSNLDLDVQLLDSIEIYDLVEKKELDIGLLLRPMKNSQVLTEHVFNEKMLLVKSEKNEQVKKEISLEELDPQHEIFMPWDLNYLEWRSTHFNNTIRPRISVNRISLLSDYISIENNWAIVPFYFSQQLAKLSNIHVYNLIDSPPDRTCYRIIHRRPSAVKKDAIDIFNTYLNKYINAANFMFYK